MTDYNKATNFATKDALVTGDPLKVVKGTEIDDELNAIEDAIGTKANIASPTFTGIPKAPTAAAGTNTTQLATTAFVTSGISNIDLTNSIGADDIIDNSVGADELNVSGDGVAGQFLISDGDGSFSWTAISVLSPASSDPTTRDDGTDLAEGDQYYNTTDDVTKTYDGSAWTIANSNVFSNAFPVTKGTSNSTWTQIISEESTGSTVHTVTSAGYYLAATEAYFVGRVARISFNTARFFMHWTRNTEDTYLVNQLQDNIPFTAATLNKDEWALKSASTHELAAVTDTGGGSTLATVYVLCYAEVGDTITLYNDSSVFTDYQTKVLYKFEL